MTREARVVKLTTVQNNPASKATRMISLDEIREKVAECKASTFLTLEVKVEVDKGATYGDVNDAVQSLQRKVDIAISNWKVSYPELLTHINVHPSERKS